MRVEITANAQTDWFRSQGEGAEILLV
jgi:hypothetical protein